MSQSFVSEPKFRKGDKVHLHNSGNEVYTVSFVERSNMPGKSHRYYVKSTRGVKMMGSGKGYYEEALREVIDMRNPITPLPGLINLPELEKALVKQDDELRRVCENAVGTGDPAAREAALIGTQLAIHERLGNMLTLLLQSGGG